MVSRDLDSSLVCIENLSKILLASVWAQVMYQQSKMFKTYLTYDVTKNMKSKTKNYFHGRLEDLPSLLTL